MANDPSWLLRQAAAALNPLLGRDLQSYLAARAAFAAAPTQPATIAVVGLTPGEGRSSVAALLAATVSAYSQRTVQLLDPTASEVGEAGRSAAALLGSDERAGGWLRLMAATARSPMVHRRALAATRTPGSAVPVLSNPPGVRCGPGQVVRTLQALRQRADVVVIDTPADPGAPVLAGVLPHVDHFVMVVRGEGAVDRRLHTVLGWLAERTRTPYTASAVVVGRGLGSPNWSLQDVPVVLLPRDEGLRRRRLDRLGRQAATAGLVLATEVLTSSALVPEPAGRRLGWGVGPMPPELAAQLRIAPGPNATAGRF